MSSEQRRSPTDILIEIKRSLYPPLPQPPEGASWVGKANEDMTKEEKIESWRFAIEIQGIIARQTDKEPTPDHPRYAEYLMAKDEYESWFKVSPADMLKDFTI